MANLSTIDIKFILDDSKLIKNMNNFFFIKQNDGKNKKKIVKVVNDEISVHKNINLPETKLMNQIQKDLDDAQKPIKQINDLVKKPVKQIDELAKKPAKHNNDLGEKKKHQKSKDQLIEKVI